MIEIQSTIQEFEPLPKYTECQSCGLKLPELLDSEGLCNICNGMEWDNKGVCVWCEK